MRRPELNKNEGIRINIEQRYFLEDSFSKQGKLRVCSKKENKVLRQYSGLCFHLHVISSICRASGAALSNTAMLSICGVCTGFHVCVIIFIVCLMLWCNNRR